MHRGLRRTATATALLFCCACGAGTGAVAKLLSDRNGRPPAVLPPVPPPPPAMVSDVQAVGSVRTPPVSFSFRLTDVASRPATVDLAFSLDGGPPQPLLVGGSSALEGLATSPAGEVHTFAWDFAAQLAAGAGRTTGVRVQVTVREGGSEAGTPELILGNDAPVVRIDNVPSGQMTSVVPIKLTISDSSADAVAVQVEYDRLGDAHGWRPATPLGLGLGDIAATPEGTSVTFLWDVAHDEPSAE